jgi:protein involved in polysaccharide export with SLBB domain
MWKVHCAILAILCLVWMPHRAIAQLTSSELFQNRIGVADTLTEKLMQRRSMGAVNDVQALEEPVDPKTYVLGPGDGLYLNVYAMHALDQDLTVTPEGRLLIPKIGQVQVAGLTVSQAEQEAIKLLSKDYKSPDASLVLRKLRPVKINVIGEVLTPGVQTVTAMQRVSEVIDRAGGLTSSSSLRNIQVRTQSGGLRTKADLFRYYSVGDLSGDPIIESGDVIVVPTAERFVTIRGSVVKQGKMEFVDGDSLSTIIHLAKGLLPSSLTDSIELARFSSSDPSHTERTYVNFARGNDPLLHDGDEIFIRSKTQYHLPRLVSVAGEVPFPGTYAIEPGTTRLKDILMRAGGVLPTGSLEEAALIRRYGVGSIEGDPELQRLNTFATMSKEGLSEQELTYYSARARLLFRSVMVVDFKSLMTKNDESQNIMLREEDSIYIPRALGYVTVSGSVNNQGNVAYIEGGSYRDYIEHAGGYSATADKSGLRVVNPKTGSYIDPRSDPGYKISPGDMIIIPQERSTFWKDLNTGTAITAQVLTIFAGIYLLFIKKP